MFVELLIFAITAALVRLYQWKRQRMRGLEHLPRLRYDLPIIGGGYRFFCRSTEGIINAMHQYTLSLFVCVCMTKAARAYLNRRADEFSN